MLAAHLDKKLEENFRILCLRSNDTIKDRLTRMVERELAEEEGKNSEKEFAGSR
jgi:hypothetical protein